MGQGGLPECLRVTPSLQGNSGPEDSIPQHQDEDLGTHRPVGALQDCSGDPTTRGHLSWSDSDTSSGPSCLGQAMGGQGQ